MSAPYWLLLEFQTQADAQPAVRMHGEHGTQALVIAGDAMRVAAAVNDRARAMLDRDPPPGVLEPCGLCGKPASLKRQPSGWRRVDCGDIFCGVTGPSSLLGTVEENERTVIDAWNLMARATRAEKERQAGALAEAKGGEA